MVIKFSYFLITDTTISSQQNVDICGCNHPLEREVFNVQKIMNTTKILIDNIMKYYEE